MALLLPSVWALNAKSRRVPPWEEVIIDMSLSGNVDVDALGENDETSAPILDASRAVVVERGRLRR